MIPTRTRIISPSMCPNVCIADHSFSPGAIAERGHLVSDQFGHVLVDTLESLGLRLAEGICGLLSLPASW